MTELLSIDLTSADPRERGRQYGEAARAPIARSVAFYAESVTQGTPEDVFTCDIIRDVFGVESKVVAHPVSGKPMCIPLRAGLLNRANLAVATG